LYPHLTLIDPAQQMALELEEYLRGAHLLRESRHQGRLDVYTTGDVQEYALRAKQVGLEPVSGVRFYPPMEIQ
jgi:glutamate racemase